MFKAIETFADLKDQKHLYRPGDVFPRDGASVDAERIRELSSNKNRLGRPLIAEIAIKAPKKGRKRNADANLPVSKELVQPKA